MLRPDQKRTDAFEFLFKTIRPRAMFIHGAPTVRFFGAMNLDINDLDDDVPVRTRVWGNDVVIMLRRQRALYTASVQEAHKNGVALAAASA